MVLPESVAGSPPPMREAGSWLMEGDTEESFSLRELITETSVDLSLLHPLSLSQPLSLGHNGCKITGAFCSARQNSLRAPQL